jgi:F0F1-type ATP synthase delta subunit
MSLSVKIAKAIRSNSISLTEVEGVLAKYKLTPLLGEIYKHLVREEKRLALKDVVQIDSPFPLSDDAIKSIKKRVGAEDKEHHIRIDTELLAGFRAKYKDTMYDGTAKRIIETFTK